MPAEKNRDLEELSASIIQNMTEGVVIENAAGYLTFVNPAAASLLGYAPDDLVGKPWTLIVPPDQHAIIRAANERRARGESDQYELELLHRDGSRRSAIVAASPRYENGVWAGALVVFTDITERQRAETALRESEISYRGLFNSVAEAIYIQDRAGNFLDVNKGAVEMYGYPREFFIGKTPAAVSAPDKNDLPAVQTQVARAFAGEPQRFEFWGKRSNGEIFPKDVRLYPGTYLGQPVVIALATDITERKCAEQELRQRAEQLALLYDAVLTLNRAIEPRQIIEHLLEIANTSVRSDRADFFRYDPDTRTLTFESGGGYADHLIPTLRTLQFTSGEPRGLVGLVAAERTPLYLPDTSADPRWIPIDPAIRSALWVPVEREQQLYGVLAVTSTVWVGGA